MFELKNILLLLKLLDLNHNFKHMKKDKIIFLGFIFFASLLVITSCRKKKDTIAKVFVKDSNGNPITTCRVILKPEPSTNSVGKTLIAADTAYTNSTGEAIFNFNYLYQLGQAGVAVLNVYANKDELSGASIIQIKEEETTSVNVSVN